MFNTNLNPNPLHVKKVDKTNIVYSVYHLSRTVSGKLPPGKFPPMKFPPGLFSPMFLNIPTRVFSIFCFFIIVTIIIDITFCNSMFVVLKSDLLRCIKKFLACRPKWLHAEKSFAGQV